MAEYSIKDLERLSGVKAHTIRIWEQRYGVLKPKRTDTNIRRYEDEELKLILNISEMLRQGGKISKLCGLSSQELSQMVEEATHNVKNIDDFYSAHVTKLMVAMIEFDEQQFEKTISHVTIKYGFTSTMVNVIMPFLNRVGIMWQIGEINVAQEHFISNLIRRKVIVAIDGLDIPHHDTERYLLYLPESELHELGLLFAKYLIKQAGKRVLYLGQSVPLHDLAEAVKVFKPHTLMTFMTSPDNRERIKSYFDKLTAHFPEQKILIAGAQINYHQFTDQNNIHFMRSIQSLQDYLAVISN